MATDPKAPAVSDLDLLGQSDNYDPRGRDVPDAIRKWVDTAYDAWLQKPDAWRATPPLSSKAAADEIVADARHYASNLREVPVSVMVRDVVEHPNGTATLHYRVRDKINAGRKSAR
jgi:hypothetical protein